jgi:hypothetical protein
VNRNLDLFLEGLGMRPETIPGEEDLREVFAGSQLAEELAASIMPVEPPPGLRARIIATVSAPARPPMGALRAAEGKWKPAGSPGITFKKLYFDPVAGLVTMLVRLEPGAVYPSHIHSRAEQCLVLEGDLVHDAHVYGPGDFTWAEAGTLDPELTTRGGTLLLLIAAPEPRRDRPDVPTL